MRAERIDLYPAQLRRGLIRFGVRPEEPKDMIADPDQALKAVGLKNRKQRFSEGGHSVGWFVHFRLRNSSVAPAQLRIFIQNQWLKSAYRAEKYRLCSDRSDRVVLLVTIFIIFFFFDLF